MEKKYVLVICRNCGNIQCYTEEYYNLRIKGNKHHKHSCQKCHNGQLNVGMKEIISNMKDVFKASGFTDFKNRNEFELYASLIRKTVDKGFEIVKVESDKD